MASLPATILSFIKRKILRLSRDRWNYQYERGVWQGLMGEEDRFQAVIRMIATLHDRPHILEIGCGDAVLLRKMPASSFASFTGIDISDVAVASAKQLEREGIRFLTGDMKAFRPTGTYDLIIFSESLYYADRPAALLKRYQPFLRPGGSFIVTAVQNKYTKELWPALEQAYNVDLSDEVSNGQHRWQIRQLVP